MQLRAISRAEVLTAGAAAVAGGVIVFQPGVQPLLLGLAAVAVGLGLARWSVDSLAAAFLWASAGAQLGKRAIFLVADYPAWGYYALQAVPTILLALAALAAQRGSRQRLPRSALWVGVMAGWWTVNTLFLSPGVPLAGRLASIHDRIMPMVGFFVGLRCVMGESSFARVGRALVFSAAVSVPYGVAQLAWGPTPLDRAWAMSTAGYSVQAAKALDAVSGSPGADWRAYSYFADPLTWGLTLVAGLAAAWALGGRLRYRRALIALLLVGLFASVVRTAWAGCVAMVLFAVALGRARWRRPALLMAVLGAGFGLTLIVGGYLYNEVFPALSLESLSSPVARRYAALGSIEARLGAWERLVDGARANPVFGRGFAYSDYYLARMGLRGVGDVGGHNVVVETVVASGLGGLALLIGFLYWVVADGTRNLRAGTCDVLAQRWLVAFLLGYAVTGYLNGGNFLNPYWFLLAGMAAGGAPRAEPVPALGRHAA